MGRGFATIQKAGSGLLGGAGGMGEVDKAADLTAVDGGPTTDIAAVTRVAFVMMGGKV